MKNILNTRFSFDMLNIFNSYLLPSQVTSGIISNFDRDGLVDWIYDYKNRYPNTDLRSNRGGYQNEDKKFFTNEETFKPYLDVINYSIEVLSREYHFNYPVEMSTAWLNINHKHCYNNTHTHPGSHLSGVLWVKLPPNSGSFVFEAPYSMNTDFLAYTDDGYRQYMNLHRSYEMRSQEGMIVLFPSYMPHYVTMNENDEDRISIAFNLKIK